MTAIFLPPFLFDANQFRQFSDDCRGAKIAVRILWVPRSGKAIFR
jgi:hypothetical protein